MTTWLEAEKAIQKEMVWLKNNILPFHSNGNVLKLPDDFFID